MKHFSSSNWLVAHYLFFFSKVLKIFAEISSIVANHKKPCKSLMSIEGSSWRVSIEKHYTIRQLNRVVKRSSASRVFAVETAAEIRMLVFQVLLKRWVPIPFFDLYFCYRKTSYFLFNEISSSRKFIQLYWFW